MWKWSLIQNVACLSCLSRSSPTPKGPWAWAAPSLKAGWASSAACRHLTSPCTSTTPRSLTLDATSARSSSLKTLTSPPSSVSTWRVTHSSSGVWWSLAASNRTILSPVPPAPPRCSLSGKPALKGNVTLSCTSSYGTPVPMYKWKRTSPTSEVFFSPMLSKNFITITSMEASSQDE